MEIIQNKPEKKATKVITKMSPGVKNPDRVNIFVNDKFDFSLNLAQVVDFKIKVGQTVTEKQLKEYRQASEFGKLYQRTLEWVLMRPRSIYETREHLKNKRFHRELENRRIVENRQARADAEYFGFQKPRKSSNFLNDPQSSAKKFSRVKTKELPLFSDAEIEAIIDRLAEHKYLDDEHFTRYYLENRNATKGTSIKKLRLELAKKGIDRNLIDQLLSENLRSDAEEIQKIIAKKRRKYDDEHLIAYLVRQGFDYDTAKNAVANFSEVD